MGRGTSMGTKIIIVGVVVLVVIAIAGGISYKIASSIVGNTSKTVEEKSEKNNSTKKESSRITTTDEKKEQKASTDDSLEIVKDVDLSEIEIQITPDSIYDSNSKRPVRIKVTNNSDYLFIGHLQVTGRGLNPLNGYFELRIESGQTIEYRSSMDPKITPQLSGKYGGNFYKTKIQHDNTLKYEIVRKYAGIGGITLFVYTEDTSDDNLIAIAKEFRANYEKKYRIVDVRFTLVRNNPTLDDSYAMYYINSINQQLHHNLVEFTDDGDIKRFIAKGI